MSEPIDENLEVTIGDHNREAVYGRFIDAGWADDMYPGETVEDSQLQAFLEHEQRERCQPAPPPPPAGRQREEAKSE